MKNMTRCIALLVGFDFALAYNANGERIPIVSYDIGSTLRSGFGCWQHTYSGTIISQGRTMSASVTCTPDGNQIADYTGGNGTLDDRVFPTTILATHLFTTGPADDGQPIVPSITLHLGAKYFVQKIGVSGGDIGGNAIPGALSGVTVIIGGNSVAIVTIPAGTPNGLGVLDDDIIDLTGTPLSGIPTDKIVLTGFLSSVFGLPFNQFSIGEITLDGALSRAPFNAFNAEAEIRTNEFELDGRFTLGVNSNGINPLTEDITLVVGAYSVMIPKGSLKAAGGGRYQFEGTIGGVALEIRIEPETTHSYTFEAQGRGVIPTGAANPVSVVLTIGDDLGATTVRAKR